MIQTRQHLRDRESTLVYDELVAELGDPLDEPHSPGEMALAAFHQWLVEQDLMQEEEEVSE